MTRYRTMTIEKPISFNGEGHVTAFNGERDIIERDGDVVRVLATTGSMVEFPWCRVLASEPFIETKPSESSRPFVRATEILTNKEPANAAAKGKK